MADLIVKPEQIQEFNKEINNLIRNNQEISQVKLMAIVAQILNKEQLKQEELLFFLKKAKKEQPVYNNNQQAKVPAKTPEPSPLDTLVTEEEIYETARLVQREIVSKVEAAVDSHILSRPFADIIVEAVQIPRLQPIMSQAALRPAPAVMPPAENPYADQLLSAEPVRLVHQQAIKYPDDLKSNMTINTLYSLFTYISQNITEKKLSVNDRELRDGATLLTQTIYNCSARIKFDPRLMGHKSKDFISEFQSHTSYSPYTPSSMS